MKLGPEAVYKLAFIIFSGVLILISGLGGLGVAGAATYYVATTGNDANLGTETQPFRTLNKGVSQLYAGDTLYVKAGTYEESVLSWQTTVRAGTSWSNPITIAAKSGDTVTIIPPDGHAAFWLKGPSIGYLIIDGFIIDGRKTAYYGIYLSDGVHHIRVRNTEIKNSRYSGILVPLCSGCADPGAAPRNTYHEFINVKSHDNGSSVYDHGFYINTSYNLVEFSEFYNNQGNGGKFFHADLIGVSNNNVARFNKFYSNSKSGKWSCGLILSSGDSNIAHNNIAYGNFNGLCIWDRVTNARLYNNISYSNNFDGIHVSQSLTNTGKIYNNTIYKNGQYGIYIGDGATNTSIKNNIAYQNVSEQIYMQPGGQTGTVTSNNLVTDPKFVNPTANDFQLQATSPAIDSGVSISEIVIDFRGLSRPQGLSYDIGAYEFDKVLSPFSPPTNLRIVSQ